ncbi:MAG: 16S rRNA (cytidine(1402)-2'-O)-methyltransferase [Chloroflexi bacterium]|nr:16S rRNA (cytidine(1402)-2'-O)-methyltransferase [Chloroflexota bacterium]
MPNLYVIATPIGNLEDISARALRLLGEVAVIASEDTRTTRKLLTHFGIRTRLLSFQEHNAAARIPQLLQTLADHDVALVSEAGTPGVSDPGASLVAAATAQGATVIPVPGPSAVTAAVSASGFSGDRFRFIGWPPRRAADRRRAFEAHAAETDTLVALESPRRVLATLAAMLAAWGDRRVAVCRELTKLHEEVFHGTLQDALDHFTEPRGEFTLVIEGASPSKPADTAVATDDARRQLAMHRAEGLTARDAVAAVVRATGLPRRAVYALWLEFAGDTEDGET